MPSDDLEFRAKMNTSGFDAGVNKMIGGAKALKASFAGIFTVGAGAAFARELTNMAGDIKDTSIALNISTDALQGQQAALAMSGVDADKYRVAMGKLTEAQQAVIAGDEKMMKAFEALGLSFRDVADSPIDELLLKMADGFKRSDDHGKSFAATMDILGKGGNRMAAALAGGREEIEKMASEATKINPESVDILESSADAATEAYRRLKAEAANGIGSIVMWWANVADIIDNIIPKAQRAIPPTPPNLFDAQPPTPPGLDMREKKEDPREIRARVAGLKEDKKAEEELLKSENKRLESATKDIKKFNIADPNERREAIRKQRDIDRAEARDMRVVEAGERVRDARSGIGKLRAEEEKAARAVNISEITINKLAAAIAFENAKLITAP